jgi:hypothetical protein
MSRPAQAVAVATARAEGVATENGPVALKALLEREIGSLHAPDDVAIEVADLVGDVAEVIVRSSSGTESQTLPFLMEDGEWRMGMSGLHRARR